MKRIFKILGYTLLTLVVLIIIGFAYIFISATMRSKKNMALLGPETKTLTIDGFSFRDLNKNGKLDIYEDRRQPVEARVNDLLGQMNIEEKAGTMFHAIINNSSDGELSETPELTNILSYLAKANSELIARKKINNFNLLQTPSTRELATWCNNIQKAAERTRLWIAVLAYRFRTFC